MLGWQQALYIYSELLKKLLAYLWEAGPWSVDTYQRLSRQDRNNAQRLWKTITNMAEFISHFDRRGLSACHQHHRVLAIFPTAIRGSNNIKSSKHPFTTFPWIWGSDSLPTRLPWLLLCHLRTELSRTKPVLAPCGQKQKLVQKKTTEILAGRSCCKSMTLKVCVFYVFCVWDKLDRFRSIRIFFVHLPAVLWKLRVNSTFNMK